MTLTLYCKNKSIYGDEGGRGDASILYFSLLSLSSFGLSHDRGLEQERGEGEGWQRGLMESNESIFRFIFSKCPCCLVTS